MIFDLHRLLRFIFKSSHVPNYHGKVNWRYLIRKEMHNIKFQRSKEHRLPHIICMVEIKS